MKKLNFQFSNDRKELNGHWNRLKAKEVEREMGLGSVKHKKLHQMFLFAGNWDM